jgi:hypothetical protein
MSRTWTDIIVPGPTLKAALGCLTKSTSEVVFPQSEVRHTIRKIIGINFLLIAALISSSQQQPENCILECKWRWEKITKGRDF